MLRFEFVVFRRTNTGCSQAGGTQQWRSRLLSFLAFLIHTIIFYVICSDEATTHNSMFHEYVLNIKNLSAYQSGISIRHQRCNHLYTLVHPHCSQCLVTNVPRAKPKPKSSQKYRPHSLGEKNIFLKIVYH